MRITSIALLAVSVCLSVTVAQQYGNYNPERYYLRSSPRYMPARKSFNDNAFAAKIQTNARYTTRTRTGTTPLARFPGGIGSRIGETATVTQTGVPPKNDEQLARGVVDMALNIGRSFSDSTSTVEIFSPVSIMGIINLLLLGARELTKTELLSTLQMAGNTAMGSYHRRAAGMLNNLLSDNAQALDNLAWKAGSCTDPDYEESGEELSSPSLSNKDLRIANAIFTQTNLPLNVKTVTLANQLYRANMQSVNFRDSLAASSLINKWVAQATNNKIREISSGTFPQDTNMVLASTLYFKATWMTEFTARTTKPRPFYPDGTDRPSFQVDTMTLSACLPYHFERDLRLRIIGLPYSDNATTMYVLMPQNSTRTKVRQLQNQLTADRLDSMLSKMQLRTSSLLFPRMQLESSTNMEKAFRQLGVKSIFSPQQSNLRLMLNQASSPGQSPLYVSQIKHKVNLSVDERGTEGAAVTMTLIDRAGSSVYFNVNQPFLIYVRHDPTRLPLFYGAVFDPRS